MKIGMLCSPMIMVDIALAVKKVGDFVFFRDEDGLIIPEKWPFHPKTQLVKDVLADECSMLMKTFFRSKR